MTPHHLILAFVYFFVVLVVLPIFCSNKVYSVHYQEDPEKNAEIEAAKREHRIRGVQEYLKRLDAQESHSFHTFQLSVPVDNLVIVIAKKPAHEEDLVLSQLVAEIDRNIRQDNIYRNALLICNATRIPFQELEDLSQFYPVLLAENTTTWRLFNSEEVIKHDFVDCITQGLRVNNFRHVTVIRDLVVPFSGFLNVVNQVTRHQLSGGMVRGEPVEEHNPWLFLHLHEPVPFRHYEFSGNCIRELLLITLSGALIFVAIFRWLEGPFQPMSTRVMYAFYGALYFLTFALVLGRPYISELRRFAGDLYRVYDPPKAIHFSALTLPSLALPDLLTQLNLLRCSTYSPFHRALDQMMTTLERSGYVISPSLVRYVVRS